MALESFQFYMGTVRGPATRASVTTSTHAAPARRSARVQASAVAPVVRTSSIRYFDEAGNWKPNDVMTKSVNAMLDEVTKWATAAKSIRG